MARNYIFDNENVYTHFIDYPTGVMAPNATLVEPPTLEKFSWVLTNESWVAIDAELALIKYRESLKELVNFNRDLALSSPPEVNINQQDTIQVQTRSHLDLINIMGVVISAMILNGQGVTSNVIQFRDANDVTRILTPTETMTMGLNVQAYVGHVYSESWRIKNLLEAAQTKEELEAIDLTIQ